MGIRCGDNLKPESVGKFSEIVIATPEGRNRLGRGGEQLMASPEILLMFKELYLVEVPATLCYNLCTCIGCCDNQKGDQGVKSFHNCTFNEGE